MAAFTSIMAAASLGVSAAGVFNAKKQAEKTASRQKAAQAKQQASAEAQRAQDRKIADDRAAERAKVAEASRVKGSEAQALDAQDKGDKVAEVAIGTSGASDALLKADPTAVASTDDNKSTSRRKTKGRKVGGVSKAKRTVGGL